MDQLVKDIDSIPEMLERQLQAIHQAEAGTTTASSSDVNSQPEAGTLAEVDSFPAISLSLPPATESEPTVAPANQPKPPAVRVTEKAMRKNKGAYFSFTREVKETSPLVIKGLADALRTQQVVSSKDGHAEVKSAIVCTRKSCP